MTDLGAITAEDEELMGTLDLKDFLPTNEELSLEADIHRLESHSTTSLEVPNLTKETVHKLEHFGHQDVEYRNPSNKHFSTMGFPAESGPNANGNDAEDIFDVDFGEEDSKQKKPQPLSATAPVKLQTPVASSVKAPPSQHSHDKHSVNQSNYTGKLLEEEEEELFVIPKETTKKSVSPKADVAKEPAVKVQPAVAVATVSSVAVSSKQQVTPNDVKAPTGTTTSAAKADPSDHTPPGSIHAEKSREDTLPGKLQKKVSEARLLQPNNNDATDDDLKSPTKEEEDEMMTDIEELLLNRKNQDYEGHGHHDDNEEFVLHSSLERHGVEHMEDLNEDVEEFEIDVDHKATNRYNRARNHHDEEEYGNYDGEDELDNREPRLHKSSEPQTSDQNNANEIKAKQRKTKLLISQERHEHSDGNENTGSKERPYQHPVNQAKFKIGGRTLNLAEAKLYGLVDAEGNQIPLSALGKTGGEKVSMKRVSDMAKPRTQLAAPTPEEEGYTFQPQRSANALKAMKNSKLGYDFVDRMKTGGDFMQRLNRDDHKKVGGVSVSKAEKAVMEEDYNARLDKLKCPNCGKEQSFDEFFERSRTCRLCNVKYAKANVSSGLGFMKQNAQREAERQRKLQKLEQDMYGDVGVTKIISKNRPISATALPSIPVRPTHSNAVRKPQGENLLAQPPTPGDQAVNVENEEVGNKPNKKNSTKNSGKSNTDAIQPHPPASIKPSHNNKPVSNIETPLAPGQSATDAVETMRRLHNSKAQTLNNLLNNLVAPPVVAPTPGDSHVDRASKPAGKNTQQRSRDSSVGRKMDRLMQMD
jgi:predicted RNA-binding Zn-ribbon protein involved in translation (DUF1610 family)